MSADDWLVYYVYDCRHTTPVKNKYVVTFKYDENKYFGLFINSEVTDFINSRDHLLPCIAEISASTNSFLKYDSFINCAKVFKYSSDELIQKEDYVCDATKDNVMEAIKKCPVMKLKWKTILLERYDD